MNKNYFVYISRNHSGNFYIGITNNLSKRIWQHRTKIADSFTSKYNIDKLIYYEMYNKPMEAILREKQLKNWNRKKKINLIVKSNPKFKEIKI